MSISGFLLRVGCAAAVYYGATHSIDAYFQHKEENPENALCSTLEQLTRETISVKTRTENTVKTAADYSKKTYVRGPIKPGKDMTYSIGGGNGILICLEITQNKDTKTQCKEFMFGENGTRFTWTIADKNKTNK